MLPGPVTIEMDRAARPATLAGERPAPRATPDPFAALAPRGLYARALREPFLLAATLALLPLALPLALAIALVNAAVLGRLSRVLFAQVRVGLCGRPFVLYKFRTMLDGPGDDRARVTAFGRFLRNTHLDELPQLWNVLRGDMTLVGPRPEMVATERWAARHCPGFHERLVLKPGLTGYAQVLQGYTECGDLASYRQKRALNRSYLERLSLALDCAILARTVVWMLRGRGWRARRADQPAPRARRQAE
jgi:lipopolysaccharide/colanic/teichoic acid biosynthesis glycosyltransferase